MITDKWTLLRCQNKETIKTRIENNYMIGVSDIGSLLMTEDFYKMKLAQIARLEEKERKLTEIEEVLEHNPLLVRDFKVAKANMDYEKKTAR